jgi:signal transduction histidine kinase/uncharacterized protein YigA (DUF484 family)
MINISDAIRNAKSQYIGDTHNTVLLRRGITYILLSILTSIGYVFLVSGISILVGSALPPIPPFVVGVFVFMLVIVLDPLRARLQRAVDKLFVQKETFHQQSLQAFTLELPQYTELGSLLKHLTHYAVQDFHPITFYIFIRDPYHEYFVCEPGEDGIQSTDIHFPTNSRFVQVLSRHKDGIVLDNQPYLIEELETDAARLALLGASVIIPLHGRNQLLGWMVLGAPAHGGSYSDADLEFLGKLAGLTAPALERAQVVNDLERRVHEMNVLIRVAQGTNFSITFDDILELIFAQTSQIIPCRDFRITLFDEKSKSLQHAFFLQDDERLAEKENVQIESWTGLEREVIKNRRPLPTDDYEGECRKLGVTPNASGIFSWIGVPMSAGSDAIGVISLGSRDPRQSFSIEQANLLQAIADQAAGAIVKTRLIQETEKRARQLASLNDIGRNLTANLEPEPLLNQILKSATEILNCAAGSLILVDENTGELVFKVVIGPVATDLLESRLPIGTGLAGEAVQTGKAIIANDAKRYKEWFDKTDQRTGFDTQDLLVVPMIVQEVVIGVIEVINKLDGTPFSEADQELIITFASQAAVAIENARLYTMTDQALAERVEELSVMQRIDRELNTSLDTERAMWITLDWAIRQTQADAGIIGSVEGDALTVIHSFGMDSEPDPIQEGVNKEGSRKSTWRLSLDTLGLKDAFQSGQPIQIQVGKEIAEEIGFIGTGFSLLNGAQSQLLIPIRREAGVIGMLVIERLEDVEFSEEDVAFLSRLSDHAAIAISNAQLFAEVKAANLAKSKFVSFVAHELKNPMSSIKGYTELVANGMAGPVSPMQASFLSTVVQNVDRMNTLVSDLNDLTKIQVGNLRLEYKQVDVRNCIEDVTRSLKRQVEEKEHQLTLELPENLPPVWADPGRVGQIMTNLLSNAIKYTRPKGEILLRCEINHSEGGGAANNSDAASLEMVHIYVQDNGIGIPVEEQEKIFQQYFRSEAAKEAAPGTGLGLNITRSLVELQGGRIWFESEFNKGSTFHIILPVAEAA